MPGVARCLELKPGAGHLRLELRQELAHLEQLGRDRLGLLREQHARGPEERRDCLHRPLDHCGALVAHERPQRLQNNRQQLRPRLTHLLDQADHAAAHLCVSVAVVRIQQAQNGARRNRLLGILERRTGRVEDLNLAGAGQPALLKLRHDRLDRGAGAGGHLRSRVWLRGVRVCEDAPCSLSHKYTKTTTRDGRIDVNPMK